MTRRDARDAGNDDTDRLITTMVRRWAVRFGAFLAGFGVAALVLNLGSSVYLATNVAVIAVGLLLRRNESTRALSTPWLIGSQLVTLVVIADVVLSAMA